MVLLKELISGLKDMLDSGRLGEPDIPEDFEWLSGLVERMTAEEALDDGVYIELARNQYCNDDLEIDDECVVSHADQGAWVSAWVWIYDADVAEAKGLTCG